MPLKEGKVKRLTEYEEFVRKQSLALGRALRDVRAAIEYGYAQDEIEGILGELQYCIIIADTIGGF